MYGLVRAVVMVMIAQFLILTLAFADEGDAPHSSRWGRNADCWEVRFGGGAFDYGPATPQDFSGGVVNAEILAPSPDFLSQIGAPRPYIGGDIAISDDPIHVLYFGLSWEFHVTERVYLGLAGGGSLNSNTNKTDSNGNTKHLGSTILFHLQANLGFDITSWLTAQIFYNHYSNAGLHDRNAGLDSMGVRLGMRY